MPVAKIHVLEGRYNEARLSSVSKAVQDALMSVLRIPPEDFYQIIYALPRNRFLHTPSFLGMSYSDDLILLDITFISGRPKETRLALLKALNDGIVPEFRQMTSWSPFMRSPARTSLSAEGWRNVPIFRTKPRSRHSARATI